MLTRALPTTDGLEPLEPGTKRPEVPLAARQWNSMALWTLGARLMQAPFPHCETVSRIYVVWVGEGSYIAAGVSEGAQKSHEEKENDVLHGCGCGCCETA